MPSAFPPPSVDLHHSRRRSGHYDDLEAQKGEYEAPVQPNQAYQPRSSHEKHPATYQDPYIQVTSPTTYQDPAVDIHPRYYPSNQEPIHGQQSNSHGSSNPSKTYANPPPDHHHAPPHGSRNQGHGALHNKRNGHNDGTGGASSNNHNIGRQPSALAPKSKGGRWEDIRAHLVAMSGEFVGTILFLWFALSATQVAAMTNPDPNGRHTPQTLLFIALAFGFSLATTAWAFYRISGGLFNPAVVLGMCVSGSLPWARGAFLVPAQIVGSIIAGALVQCMFPGDVSAVITRLAPGVSVTRGVFIEMFLTSLLVFTILMLAAEKHPATFVAPVGIGLALFVAELSGVYFTGGSLNPARSFGPSVAARSFPGHHWVYWVGPALGGLVAAAYYRMVKYLNYEEANPGQDATKKE